MSGGGGGWRERRVDQQHTHLVGQQLMRGLLHMLLHVEQPRGGLVRRLLHVQRHLAHHCRRRRPRPAQEDGLAATLTVTGLRSRARCAERTESRIGRLTCLRRAPPKWAPLGFGCSLLNPCVERGWRLVRRRVTHRDSVPHGPPRLATGQVVPPDWFRCTAPSANTAQRSNSRETSQNLSSPCCPWAGHLGPALAPAPYIVKHRSILGVEPQWRRLRMACRRRDVEL